MAHAPTTTLPELPGTDDEADSASDWEATAQDGELQSLAGTDDDDAASNADSESIGSQSTDEEDRDESDDAAEAPPAKKPASPKVVAKPAKKAAAAPKQPKAAAAKKIKPKQKKIKVIKAKPKPKEKPKVVPVAAATAAVPEADSEVSGGEAAVKIIKYTSNNASGAAGRPLKNAVVVVPAGHSPSEYPSVAAFRENPPTSPEQYLRVNLQGRKPAAYRAFRVKSLQPPFAETCYVLSAKEDDEAALKELGVTDQLPELAAAAKLQHKKDHAGLAEALKAVKSETLRKLGVPIRKSPGHLEAGDPALAKLPAIMNPDLAEALAAPPKPPPSKKRPADPPAAEANDDALPVAKRIRKQLEAALGGTVTSFTFTMDVRQDAR